MQNRWSNNLSAKWRTRASFRSGLTKLEQQLKQAADKAAKANEVRDQLQERKMQMEATIAKAMQERDGLAARIKGAAKNGRGQQGRRASRPRAG